jgi:hypothetical protein
VVVLEQKKKVNGPKLAVKSGNRSRARKVGAIEIIWP